MFCGNCGNPLENNSKFCGACGTAATVSDSAQVLMQASPPVDLLPENKKSKTPFILAAFVLCIAIAAVAASGFFFFQMFGAIPMAGPAMVVYYEQEQISGHLQEQEDMAAGEQDAPVPSAADTIAGSSFELEILENFLAAFRSLFMEDIFGFGGGEPFFDFARHAYIDPITGGVISQSPYVRDGAVMDMFTLYDFNGDGIPTVVIRWVWPQTGGGFPHEIHHFQAGEYRLLAILTSPEFFRTPEGDIIAFEWNYGDLRISRLLQDAGAGSVEILADWGIYDYFHIDWGDPAFFNNLFNGPITPIAPLSTLQQGIHNSITERLRNEGRLPAARAAIMGRPFPGQPIGTGSDDTEAIYFIQNSLNLIHRYFPSVREIESVSGIFGAGTRGAVIDFQFRMGLNTTGIVDEATWQRMIEIRDNPPSIPDPPFFPTVNTYYITLSNLHLRAGPSTEAESLYVVPEGTAVWAVEFLHDAGWFRVISHDGQHGFMSAQFLVLDGIITN